MNSLAIVLLLSGPVFSEPPATSGPCTLGAPWDSTRELLAKSVGDPGVVPITEVDNGELLNAVTEWLRAWHDGDVESLVRLTIPLPDQYQQVNRDWLEKEAARLTWQEAEPMAGQLDPSNAQHILALSEVAVRIDGQCVVSAVVVSWIKLNGRWRAFPGIGSRL